MYDLVIKNARIVSPYVVVKADIGIKGTKISKIGSISSTENSAKTIDAANNFVLPGIIDAHMHVEAPFQGCFGANDFYTQSISAAFGGVTTFMDFTNTFKGKSVIDAFHERKREMSKSAIDYSIHGKLVEFTDNTENELNELIKLGCTSYKMFMTYKKEGVMMNKKSLKAVLELSKNLNFLPIIHAEDNDIAEENLNKLKQNNKMGWKYFPEYKPINCEAIAVKNIIKHSIKIGNPLLIVHTTNGDAISHAIKAQQKKYPIYIETCPQYLTLTDKFYNKKNGYLAICSPPLRSKTEAQKLWSAILNNSISITGSDDCTYSIKEKSMFLSKKKDGTFIQNFTKVVNGCSGIETRLPILISEGVSKERISINKLCEITSTNIAKLFGCYPKKGIIQPGSDADIVIIDMNKTTTISHKKLHSNINYSLYEGMKIKGMPTVTISKGKVIMKNNEFKGCRSAGEFIERKINKKMLIKFNL